MNIRLVNTNMVILHVKRLEKEFLFESTTAESVDTVIRQLVDLFNFRLRLGRVAEQAELLAKHGPSKKPDFQGLPDDMKDLTLEEEKLDWVKPENYCPDPTAKRTGAGKQCLSSVWQYDLLLQLRNRKKPPYS